MLDPLTHIVQSLGLVGGVFLEGEFTAPWAITAHVTEEDCKPFMPIPKQVIAYHVVTEGELILAANNQEHLAKAGDVIIFPANNEHLLASDASVPAILGDDLLLPAGECGLVRIQHGGGGARTCILCGFLASQSAPSILIESLPEVLIVSLDDVATLNWIEVSIAMAARELSAGRVASKSVMSRLSELLIIEALRVYLEGRPKVNGWLAGMADQKIARALVRIHEDLERPPSVVELAGVAGMSRSAFVDRFSELLGSAPRRYILDQRMQTACLLLRETSLGLSDVSLRVGYEATEAFSRAFKRETGKTPIEYRLAQAS
ncbi:MAG: AraC family transcriptional regulator [Pseudomonadota bacterium]